MLSKIPMMYSDSITNAFCSVKNAPINNIYTGSRAEQLINGTIIIVMARSFLLVISRAAMMAGTLQPKPISIGMNELPCNPIRCMILSMVYATRAMYPESSIRLRKKNMMMIFGRKANTAPIPITTPSMSRLLHHTAGINPRNHSARASIPIAIHSCG